MGKSVFSVLYNEHDKQILKTAQDTLDPKVDRVQEIIEYSRGANIKKIGIAHCLAFNNESSGLEKILTDEGFLVERVSCKYGHLPFNDVVEGYKGTSCNPAGQAKYLEEKGTELNIMMGLCLGHDMIFNARSAAPVTPLIVKDRKLSHKTIEKFRSDL
jgi:uncharacterized metal-binding protein